MFVKFPVINPYFFLQHSYPTIQRIILVETPPTPVPPETSTTAQQPPVTDIPNKQEPTRRKSIDAAYKKPETDDKTDDRSNKKFSVTSPAENSENKQSISSMKISLNGSKSEDESERSRKVSLGSSSGSERIKKAENRKDRITSSVSMESDNAGPRASLSEVTLSELPVKTDKSETPAKAAGDVKRESQGQAGCEDKGEEDNVKRKQKHRKISSWLFEDNENENKNKSQTGKHQKKLDETDKGEKKREENGVGTSKDEDKTNTTSNKMKREKQGRRDPLTSGGSNNAKDKIEGEGNGGNMKDNSASDSSLQQWKSSKDDKRRSMEIMSVEGEDDDQGYDNDGDDDDFDNEEDKDYGSSENGGNSPRGTTIRKPTERRSRKGRGRRRKITFSKLNWNAQSKIDSGLGNYKPRKSDVTIPNFKSNYSHVKSRGVSSLKESNTTDNAASDKEPYRRRSLYVNKTSLPQYYNVRPRLYDGIAQKYNSDIPDSIPKL